MGYASPSTGYQGYVASDNSLVKITGVQGVNELDWTDIYTGAFITDLRVLTTLRFKVEINNPNPGTVYVRLQNTTTEETYAEFSQANNGVNYTAHQADFALNVNIRGQTIAIQGKQSGGAGSLRNTEIAGTLSPVTFS